MPKLISETNHSINVALQWNGSEPRIVIEEHSSSSSMLGSPKVHCSFEEAKQIIAELTKLMDEDAVRRKKVKRAINAIEAVLEDYNDLHELDALREILKQIASPVKDAA